MAVVVAGVALMSDQIGLAVFALFAIGGLAFVQAFGRSEWAVIQGGAADERQRSINAGATQFAYTAVLTIALVGLLTEIARGEAGPFTLICSVGGFSHMSAIAYLRRRR
jgi:hypothetical protein